MYKNLIWAFLLPCALINAQQTIYVNDWVVEPSYEDMNKPLIVLDFWATWCGPCLIAMPETERLMQNYEEDVLLLYTSEEPSLTVQKFMEKKGKSFYSSVDTQGRNTDLFQVGTIPTTIILDPEGNVIWKGPPTDLNKNLLDKFIRKYKSQTASPYRFSIDTPKENELEEIFEVHQSKGLDIEYTISNAESDFIEILSPNFYFNGKLEKLVAYLYDMPAKNISNHSSLQEYYTIKSNFTDENVLKKALENLLKSKLNLIIDSDAKITDTYVLTPTSTENFFNSNTYDFSENKAKYLASDMDVEIDNETVDGMVKILNKFSELNFEAEGFDEKVYDWSIHFKFNQFTLEQLEHDYHFNIEEDQRLVQKITLKDRN